jgi:hypothetical protein
MLQKTGIEYRNQIDALYGPNQGHNTRKTQVYLSSMPRKCNRGRLRSKNDGTCEETRFCLTAFEMWWHMRRNQISSYCVWNMMAHAQKPDFVLLRSKCDGTCAETRFSLTAFEKWWHMRRNQISSYCVWKVMAHAQKPDFVFRRNGRGHLNQQGSSVQSTTGRRAVRISGSNAGSTMFRGSVKSTGYPLHSPVSSSLPFPCVTVCHHIWTGL